MKSRGILANALVGKGQVYVTEQFFSTTPSYEGNDNEHTNMQIPEDILNGQCAIIFAHPEALLSKEGRELMTSQVFQENVAACVIDEAHCVELW